MKDKGGGAIVNLSSVSGVRGSKGRSAYGSSKGAVKEAVLSANARGEKVAAFVPQVI